MNDRRTRFTPEQVQHIRATYKPYVHGLHKLAKECKASKRTIFKIVNFHTHKKI